MNEQSAKNPDEPEIRQAHLRILLSFDAILPPAAFHSQIEALVLSQDSAPSHRSGHQTAPQPPPPTPNPNPSQSPPPAGAKANEEPSATAKAMATAARPSNAPQQSESLPIWSPLGAHDYPTIHEFYQDELLASPTAFLFSDAPSEAQCRHYRASPNVLARLTSRPIQCWTESALASFLGPTAQDLAGKNEPAVDAARRRFETAKPLTTLKLDFEHGVELFLAPDGVGLISIAFTLESLDPDTLLEALHRLTQTHLNKRVLLRFRGPQDHVRKFGTAEQEARELPTGNLLAWSKGHRTMTLPTIACALLGIENECLRTGNAHHFVTARLTLPASQDISNDTTCAWSAEAESNAEQTSSPRPGQPAPSPSRSPLPASRSSDLAPRFSALALGLAQQEEPTHAGWAPGVEGPAAILLNQNHLCAVGLYGAAHLVSDQTGPGYPTPNSGFNAERLPRVANKYFIPFLLSLIQRQMFESIAADAARILATGKDDNAAEALGNLEQRLGRAVTGGTFGVVSSREVLQRFYEICRTALRCEPAYLDARRSVHDLRAYLDDKRSLEIATHQERLLHQLVLVHQEQQRQDAKLAEIAKDQTGQLKELKALQHSASRFELLIIAAYALESAHILGQLADGEFAEAIFVTAAATAALLAAAIAHGREHRTTHPDKDSARHWRYFAGIVAFFWIALAVAFLLRQPAPNHPPNPHNQRDTSRQPSPTILPVTKPPLPSNRKPSTKATPQAHLQKSLASH